MTRTSHQPPAAHADASALRGRAPSSRFDVPSSTPAASTSGPRGHAGRRLYALATNVGEICGLTRLNRASGVTLTETLVAILVMSTAALGLAGLQAENLRANREAYARTVAVQRAADMLDRIRANPAVGANEFEVGSGPPAMADCLYIACDPATMARFDIAVWRCALGAWREVAACRRIREADALADADAMPGLPEGDGAVVVDPALGLVTVTVSWRGSASRSSISIASRT